MNIPKNDQLVVWYADQRVGRLWRNTAGIMGFYYDDSWIDNGFPISQQLPLESREFPPESEKAHHFFANLLPEAHARLHIVRDLKISNSDFEILRAIGGECAGAISILPMEQNPNDAYQYQKISAEALDTILLRKGRIYPLPSIENRPRLSLAGAHDKCPVFFDGRDYFLPLDSSPSTHILKFEITDYRNIPLYEYFTTKLAQAVGLPVVEIVLVKKPKHHFLLIERYDRIQKDNSAVQRLHQEDFCQALGFSSDRKYQQEGGPTFLDCYQLIEKVSANPVADLNNLIRWQIFNVLAGNADGHAKNLALLYNNNNQVRLAPFYDLVCTRAIKHINPDMALSIGNVYNPDKITWSDWEKLGQDCDIQLKHLKKLIREMCVHLPQVLKQVKDSLEQIYGSYPALQRIEQVVNKQCKKVLREIELQ